MSTKYLEEPIQPNTNGSLRLFRGDNEEIDKNNRME